MQMQYFRRGTHGPWCSMTQGRSKIRNLRFILNVFYPPCPARQRKPPVGWISDSLPPEVFVDAPGKENLRWVGSPILYLPFTNGSPPCVLPSGVNPGGRQ